MKRKRWILVLGILAVLIIGWFLSIRAASGIEIRKNQDILAGEADYLAAKELYVRAIPMYKKALGYETAANSEIEARLLASLQAFGDYDSFVGLVEKRAVEGTAKEWEYLTAAQYYINSRGLYKAMALLQRGMEKLGGDKLSGMYEANRYGYTLRMTGCEEIIPTADNSFMPAFDGEKWGYVDDSGRALTDFSYDSATPYNSNGYAVVSLDGKYYVITRSGAKYGVDETGITRVLALTPSFILAQAEGSYSYYNYDFQCVAPAHQYEEITANACGLAAVKKNGKWGIITDGGATVVDFVLEDVAVNSLGSAYAGNAAMVRMDGEWYLVDTEGKKIKETGYASAKAPESDGYIAVANKEGLWGFINRQGDLVIDYQYTDALSFSQHLAAVEKGGSWGYISENNKLVIEQYMEDAMPFHNGIAQARFVDGEGLLKLEYFED